MPLTPIQKITNWSKLSNSNNDIRGKTLYTTIHNNQIILSNVQYNKDSISFDDCESCLLLKKLGYNKTFVGFLSGNKWVIPVPPPSQSQSNEFWDNLSLSDRDPNGDRNGGRLRPPLSIKKRTRFRNIQKNKQTRRSSKMRSK